MDRRDLAGGTWYHLQIWKRSTLTRLSSAAHLQLLFMWLHGAGNHKVNRTES
jgi:hypothetical protein